MFVRTMTPTKLLLVLVAVISLPTVVHAQAASCATTWKSVGPTAVDIYDNNYPVGIGAMTGLILRGETLYVGSVNGGVWRTDNFHTNNAHYIPLTDQQRCNGISALAVHPTNSQFVVAGCGSPSNAGVGGDWQGVLITKDGGTTWTRGVLNPNQQSVVAAVILADNSILVATHLVRVKLSTGSYQNVLDNSKAGIFRSTDGGATWTKVYSGWVFDMRTDATQTQIYALGSSFNSNTQVWSNLMYLSTDGGVTWSPRGNGFVADAAGNNNGCGIQGVVSVNAQLAVQTSNTTQYLLAIVFTQGDNPTPSSTNPTLYCYDYYFSSNHGDSWDRIVNQATGAQIWPDYTVLGVQGGNNLYLMPDPTQLGTFYLGATDLARYRLLIKDLGTSLDTSTAPVLITQKRRDPNVAGKTTDPGNPHSDARYAIWDPTTNGIIETDDGGIFTLANPRDPAGSTWTWARIQGDFATSEQNSISYDPTSGLVVAAAQDNSVQISKASLSTSTGDFFSTGAGDGVSTAIDTSVTPAVFYSGIQHLEYIISWAAGATLANTQIGLPTTGYTGAINYQPFGITIQDPTALLKNNLFDFTAKLKTNPFVTGQFMTCSSSPAACYTVQRTSRTPSGKDVITNLNAPAKVYQVWNQGGKRNNQNVAAAYWAAGPVSVWATDQSTSGGTTNPPWKAASGDPGFRILGLGINPNNYYQAYLTTTESKIYTSNDFGQTWSCNTFPTQPWGVSVIPFNSSANAVIVGTQNGVYVALDNTAWPWNWNLLGLGLPNVLATEFDYDTNTDMLVVSTMGRGIWTYTGLKTFITNMQTCATPAQNYFLISQNEGTLPASATCSNQVNVAFSVHVSAVAIFIIIFSWILIQQ